jgi:hypothetical protein
VKYAISLVFIVAVFLTSCNTLSNRRDLFAPAPANGPWNKKLAELAPPPSPALQPLHQVPVPLPAPVQKPLHQ